MPKATKPIKRSKPLAARNQQHRPSDKASLQRELVLARAGNRCEFEVWTNHFLWERCILVYDLQCAHTFRRRHTNTRSIYDPDVAVAACTPHHKAWDAHRRDGIRLPPGAEERARAAINAAAKTEQGHLAPGEHP